jgi:Transposase DDE domain
VYSPTIILRCFIVRIWFRLDSNRSLHHFLCLDLPYNQRIMKACGLSVLHFPPSRRTFDRRLKTMSTDIKERIATMGNMFVIEGLVRPYVVATDTALLKSKGKVWHKSSMSEGIVRCSGIDTEAKWGYSHTKGWVFGYKLHMVSSSGSPVIVPLSADVTTANVSDKPVYPDVVSYLSTETLKEIHYMVADPGYDGKKLYDLSLKKGFQLVCPIKRYKNTPVERLKLVDFYESALGQVVYSRRRTSIEPLIEHMKAVFRIDPVPVRGLDKVRGILLLSILLYQILVYYNCKVQKEGSVRSIKYMIGC